MLLSSLYSQIRILLLLPGGSGLLIRTQLGSVLRLEISIVRDSRRRVGIAYGLTRGRRRIVEIAAKRFEIFGWWERTGRLKKVIGQGKGRCGRGVVSG